jgi:hypothetical protein
MSKLESLGLVCMLALAVHAGPASAQYMYLDANGNGINTVDDQLKWLAGFPEEFV